MTLTRIGLILTLTVTVGLLVGCSDKDGSGEGVLQGGAEAACAAPEVTVDPSPVVAGEAAQLTVVNLSDGCNDTGEGKNVPASAVTVSLRAEDGSWGPSDVATVDAADDLTASAMFLLPSDTVPGGVLVALNGVDTGGFEVVAP